MISMERAICALNVTLIAKLVLHMISAPVVLKKKVLFWMRLIKNAYVNGDTRLIYKPINVKNVINFRDSVCFNVLKIHRKLKNQDNV